MTSALSAAVVSARAEEVKLLAVQRSARPRYSRRRRNARTRAGAAGEPARAQLLPC